ncbi:MAG: DUF6516 family protein [Candidatus Odinarchaeota archaeon]
MSSLDKLNKAKQLIRKSLDQRITSYAYQANHNQLKFTFRDGSVLYVIYNRIGEYAYQLLFSKQSLDRVRFDSMDKEWNVDTKPNHFHPRGDKKGYRSPMIGNPEDDIPELVKLILSGELKNRTKRF